MSGYLSLVISRLQAAGPAIRPRLPSRFEPPITPEPPAQVEFYRPERRDMGEKNGLPPTADASREVPHRDIAQSAASPRVETTAEPAGPFARHASPAIEVHPSLGETAAYPKTGAAESTPVRLASAGHADPIGVPPLKLKVPAKIGEAMVDHSSAPVPQFESVLRPAAHISAPTRPEARREASPTADTVPTVRVTIGRIDVRADLSEPRNARRPSGNKGAMSLDEYLKKRSGR